MNVSIVVPAFNEEKILGRSLAAIKEACAAFTERGWDSEIVVCDNNSTDRTSEIARESGAHVVFEPINQISRARNRGGFAAKGDWLIFVDADSFPSVDLFRRTAELITSGSCIGGGCQVRLDEQMLVTNFLVGVWNTASRLMKWAAGSFVYCEAKAFRELNGFSEKLFASEEIEFSSRLKKLARSSGRKVIIIRDARLTTSARKMHLYTPGEYLWFALKATVMPHKVMASRDDCMPWYDGRR